MFYDLVLIPLLEKGASLRLSGQETVHIVLVQPGIAFVIIVFLIIFIMHA